MITAVGRLYDAIGWDAEAQAARPSALLSAGTWEEIIAASSASLQRSHPPLADASALVSRWSGQLEGLHACDSPVIADLPGFLRRCRDVYGLTVAVCTSDSRHSTEQALHNWDVTSLVDHVVCGDDGHAAKPSVEPLLELCERARVRPADCIVVGDTLSDTQMARSAGTGLAVGVLTGSGTPEQLTRGGAHLIVPSIGDLPRLFDAMRLTRVDDMPLSAPAQQQSAARL